MLTFFKLNSLLLLIVIPVGFISGYILDSFVLGFFSSLVTVLCWIRPDWAFLLFLAVAPLARSPKSSLISVETIAQTKALFVFILGVIFLIKFMNKRPLNIKFPAWLRTIIALWLTLTLFSWFQSRDPLQSLSYLFVSSSGLVIFLVSFFSERELLKDGIRVILGTAFLVSCLCLLQYVIMKYGVFSFLGKFILAPREIAYLQVQGPVAEDLIYRTTGTFPHPNQLGTYLALLVPIVCALLTQKKSFVFNRPILVGILFVILVAIFTSNSRNSVLMVCVSLFFLSFHRPFRWLWFLFLVGSLILAGLFLTFPNKSAEYFQKITRVQTGVSSRETIWSTSFDLFLKNPILGVGPGNFTDQYVSHYGYFIFDNASDVQEQALTILRIDEKYSRNIQAHNVYLQLACELGFAAPLLFLISVGLIIYYCEKKAWTGKLNSFESCVAMSVASLTFAFLFFGIFDSHFSFQVISINHLVGPIMALGIRV